MNFSQDINSRGLEVRANAIIEPWHSCEFIYSSSYASHKQFRVFCSCVAPLRANQAGFVLFIYGGQNGKVQK